ncbi:MAG TPA: FG-GAP-like repeat-containing protein [bacterium]|nr:FG-GAP-like repeat-containing protein [bacterium]
MRFAVTTLAVVLGSTCLGASAQAQTLFQNTNQPCEFEEVICASETCGDSFPDALSLACRFINIDETFSGVDFSGDGFADCVALRPETSSAPTPNLSVLINRGAAATACEPGPGDQFNTSLDYDLNSLDDDASNVVAGNLNSGNADIGVATIEGDQFLQAFNPGTGFGPDGSALNPTGVDYDIFDRDQNVIESFNGERVAALFDCNGDNTLEAVLAVEEQSPVPLLRINILRNNGSGLQPISGLSDSVSTNVFWDQIEGEFLDSAMLTIGDFDNDSDLDVAVAADVSDDSGPSEEVVNLCFNNGACDFTCEDPPTIDLFAAHPGDNPAPSSVEAGDFNGDDNTDLVVALPFLDDPTPLPQGLQYYFGDGAGNFPNTQFNPYPFAGVLSLDLATLSTGCYNNDNVRDVAVVSTDAENVLNNVGIFTSDGSGGLNPSFPLFIGGTFADGIDTADFDQAGGDDIMVLADVEISPSPDLERQAVIFMNGLETVSAIAGADQTADLNQAVAISGASCNVSPEITDPFSDPASFEVLWTLSPAAGATLSGADTLTPTITASVAGAYTLTLSCRTRCTTIVTDTKTVTVGGIPIPTPTPTPTPPPSFTQGGCLADLSPTASLPSAWAWLLGSLGMGGAWIQSWRRTRKSR